VKDWWYANWRTLLETIGVVAAALIGAAGVVTAAWIGVRKKKDKQSESEQTPAMFQSEQPEQSSESIKPTYYNYNFRIAEGWEEQQNYEKALEHYLQSAEDYGEDLENRDRAAALNSAGVMCVHLARYEEANDCFIKAQAIYRAKPEAKQVELAEIYHNRAVVYSEQQNYEKALFMFENALAIKEEMLGKDNPNTATTYGGIGIVYLKQERFDDALNQFLKALAIFEKKYGKYHPDTVNAYNNIAIVKLAQNKYFDALEYHYKVLAVEKKRWGDNATETALSKENIALVYGALGRYNDAITLYLQAYQVLVDKLGAEHPSTRKCLYSLRNDYNLSGLTEPFETWLAAQGITLPQ